MTLTLDVLTTMLVGSMIGTEFAVSAFINPIILKLDIRAEATASSLFAAKLGNAMPFWYAINLALLIAETVVRRHEAGNALLISSCAIWITVVLLTLLFLVPISNRIARMNADSYSETLRRERTKWDNLHRLRVLALGASMACFLIGIHI